MSGARVFATRSLYIRLLVNNLTLENLPAGQDQRGKPHDYMAVGELLQLPFIFNCQPPVRFSDDYSIGHAALNVPVPGYYSGADRSSVIPRSLPNGGVFAR
jgi:hypothetical protein